MFSLFDIEGRIRVFRQTADETSIKAELVRDPVVSAALRGCASGLVEAARSLERLVDEAIMTENEVRGL